MIRSLSRVLAGLILAASSSQTASAAEDFDDMSYVTAAIQHVLEKYKTGQAYEWSNPDTGNSGIIVAERTFYLDARTPCRDYRRTTEGWGGSRTEVTGTGCRTQEGWWKLNENRSRTARTEAPYEAGTREEARSAPETGDAERPSSAAPESDKGKPTFGRSGPPARGLPDRIPEGSTSAAESTSEDADSPAGSERMDPAEAGPEAPAAEAGDPDVAEAEAAEDVPEADIAEIATAAGPTPPLPKPRPVTPRLASSLPTRSEE